MATDMQNYTKERNQKISDRLKRGRYFLCEVCAAPFWRKPSAIAKGDCRFCSRECYIEWQKGVPKSQSYRDFCAARTGENNPNWRGGKVEENQKIRNGKEIRSWRKSVFERDGFTCQKCGKKRTEDNRIRLDAHHIKPFAKFPDLRFDVNNGLTLCGECHGKEPKGKHVWYIT